MSSSHRHGRRWLSLSYSLLLYLVAPFLLIHTAIRAIRERDSCYFRQRLGFYRHQNLAQPIWVHAASVGEVASAEPLLRSLKTRLPNTPMLVTTGTIGGKRMARLRLSEISSHVYLPIDFPGAVSRFLKATRPKCALIMETELWFNLYKACSVSNVPVVVVNGRLSPRTLRAGSWLKHFYAETLARVDRILARSNADKEGFVALGASPHNIKVIGNLKFAASPPTDVASKPVPTRPYVLAASTHDDEELRILRLWLHRDRHQLLVIAPRHPDRLKDILRQLRPLSNHIAIHSSNDGVSEGTEVYIVDTLGELGPFMAKAELVFVGGSLVPRGGHNVLEPALLGKATIFGPHMNNFINESKLLLEHEAAIQIKDDADLEACLTSLLESPEKRQQLARRAASAVNQYQDIAQRYTDEITDLCNLSQP